MTVIAWKEKIGKKEEKKKSFFTVVAALPLDGVKEVEPQIREWGSKRLLLRDYSSVHIYMHTTGIYGASYITIGTLDFAGKSIRFV